MSSYSMTLLFRVLTSRPDALQVIYRRRPQQGVVAHFFPARHARAANVRCIAGSMLGSAS